MTMTFSKFSNVNQLCLREDKRSLYMENERSTSTETSGLYFVLTQNSRLVDSTRSFKLGFFSSDSSSFSLAIRPICPVCLSEFSTAYLLEGASFPGSLLLGPENCSCVYHTVLALQLDHRQVPWLLPPLHTQTCQACPEIPLFL